MFGMNRKRYVVLQETVSPDEERAINRAVIRVLPPVEPSQAFVQQLGRDLVAEARRQYTTQPVRGEKLLQILGYISGGIFSLIGGITLWLLIQRNHETQGSNLNLPTTQPTAASAGSA